MNKKKGYSLVELIIVISIFTVLAIILFPTSIAQLQKNRMQNIVIDLASNIFQYQQNAFARKNNKSYGVAFNNNYYTFFIGNSLATAEEVDQTNLSSNSVHITQINLSNSATEIDFTAGSFRPSNFGNIVFNDGHNNYHLYINSEGVIDYY